MNLAQLKHARQKLDPDSYRRLRQQVLQRDGWKCQCCGTMELLQVHHQELRSRSGSDTAENLITLCSQCHTRLHSRHFAAIQNLL